MLEGTTVLDLSQVGPGARCTWLLADLGASVVKVLPPAAAERWSPPDHAYGAGRGTHRARIDLKRPEGVEVFLRLAASADVVVESYRPGVADRLGIGFQACKARNPAIVYAAITGYGQDGPYAQWAGHDLNYLAVGGYLAAQGRRADGGPAHPGATIADSAGGGMQAALAICAALVRGEGAYLDVSTTEGVLFLTALQIDEHLATGRVSELLSGRFACYDLYRCRDGRWLSVAAIEPKFFANLCASVGRPDLAAHQMDESRQDELRAALQEAFSTRDRDDWAAELGPADCCVAPVLEVDEVASDPHLRARGAIGRARRPDGATFGQVAPVVAGAMRPDGPVAVPSADDTDAVLAGAGFTSDELAALKGSGAVG